MRRALEDVFARPEYRWVEARSPLQWLGDLWYRLVDWWAALERAHPLEFKLLLGVLIAALVALLAHIGWVLWRITRPTARTPATAGAPAALRLEDGRAHRARADALAGEGRYAEALGHRFAALLLELERRRALTFHASKTPAEYVREARLDPSGRDSLAELVGRLYRHLFGAVPCDAAAYGEFVAAADLVPRHVAPG